jgi:glutathione peroxidase-family protein
MSSAANAAAPTLHTFQGTSIDASKLSMSAFAGKPVLMVNVASR